MVRYNRYVAIAIGLVLVGFVFIPQIKPYLSLRLLLFLSGLFFIYLGIVKKMSYFRNYFGQGKIYKWNLYFFCLTGDSSMVEHSAVDTIRLCIKHQKEKWSAVTEGLGVQLPLARYAPVVQRPIIRPCRSFLEKSSQKLQKGRDPSSNLGWGALYFLLSQIF